MKNGSYRLIYKTLAFLLCIAAILAAAAGGLMTAGLALGGSAQTEEGFLEQYFSGQLATAASRIRMVYCQQTESDIPVEALMNLWGWRDDERSTVTIDGAVDVYPGIYVGQSNLRCTIKDQSGKLLAGNYNGDDTLAQYETSGRGDYLGSVTGYLWDLQTQYALAGWEGVEPPTADSQESRNTEPTSAGGENMEATAPSEYYGESDNPYVRAWYWTLSDQPVMVTVYLLKDLSYDDSYSQTVPTLQSLYAHRGMALWLLVGGLLAMIPLLVYLCAGAGRRPGEAEIQLNVLDRIPLDLYAVVVVGIQALLFFCAVKLASATELGTFLGYSNSWALSLGYGLTLIGILTAMILALGLGLTLSFAARCKYGHGYWWRRSILGWCLRKIWHGVRWCLRALRSLYHMLPVIWRWLVLGLAFWIWNVAATASMYGGPWLALGTLLFLGLTAYGAWAMGKLQKQAAKLASGDFTGETPQHMHGVFQKISQDMGAVGQGASIAVENQMKSERLKTELITNVSHDIKTPLTSIVNYVDLLQKPHTPEEETEYLAVLDRQSKRMKKLIEDLVEMSKASTGNIPAYLVPTNLVELTNQALAEYDGKLKLAGLTPEVTVLGRDGKPKAPEDAVTVMADGRLLWRVLDNLLGNAVKYAMPGTRLYVDIVEYERSVMLSVKNISKNRLNISADELMERFARGDSSRSTEGSGLGLNIAKSLMELQKAKLNLIVDGDLFKAVLLYDPMPKKEPDANA